MATKNPAHRGIPDYIGELGYRPVYFHPRVCNALSWNRRRRRSSRVYSGPGVLHYVAEQAGSGRACASIATYIPPFSRSDIYFFAVYPENQPAGQTDKTRKRPPGDLKYEGKLDGKKKIICQQISEDR